MALPTFYFMLIVIDNAALFANLIARTAQDIDTLIDSLPSKELTPEKQVDTLRKLELENQQSAERLSRAVKEGGERGIEGEGERERGERESEREREGKRERKGERCTCTCAA